MNKFHERYMRRCLELAGMGNPHPNPYVGAVLIDEKGEIIAEGYHSMAGEEHAEAQALRKFKVNIQNAKLYINLEPCCYSGRVHPCTDTIISSGIKTVIVAMKDPNPRVNGKGIEILRRSGIKVTVGVLQKEARLLNEQFVTFHAKHRPFIALKLATTLDGKIATRAGDSKWITSLKMRAHTRLLRARHQAILIGVNTVLKDDPHLGARSFGKRDQMRIILDSKLRSPLKAKALRDKNVIIATTSRATLKKIKSLEKQGIFVWVCASDRRGFVHLPKFMERMRDHGIISCFVEGGGRVASSFLSEGLVDKIYWAIAPKILGDEKAVSAISGRGILTMRSAMRLKNARYTQIDDDILCEGYTR